MTTPGSRAAPQASPARRNSSPLGRALTQAVLTAVVLLVLVAAAYAIGRRAFFGLVCTVALIALFELLDALRRSGRHPVRLFGLAAGLGLLAAAYSGRAGWLIAVAAATSSGAFALALRPERGPTPASDAAWTILAVAWVAGGASAAVGLIRVDPGGLSLLVAFVCVVALDDIAAFFAGSWWGRHKMAPSISPAKSWEGGAAGAVAALGAGLAAGGLLGELSALEGLGLGAICALGAPIGDLVESLVKREIGVKDSSRLLPGHGGFLDRVDAMVFCAPAVLVYVWLLPA